MAREKPLPPIALDHGAGEFGERVNRVLEPLQIAMKGLIASIPGAGEIRRATDLQRALSIPSKLAWQVFQVAADGNGRVVPGANAMERFLDTAVGRGVPPDRVNQVRSAFASFQELVRVHAGSRSMFDSMVGRMTEDGSEPLDLMHRRAAFRANVHFLGARAKTLLDFSALKPDPANPATLEWLGLKGMIGLRTLRADTSWELSNVIPYRKGTAPLESLRVQPIDPAGATDGIFLFRDFCTLPLPSLKFVPRENEAFRVLVTGQVIDNTSPVNLVLGFIAKDGEPRYRTGTDTTLRVGPLVRVPAEVLIQDVLIHRDIFQHASPRMSIYNALAGTPIGNNPSEYDLLPMRENVLYLGSGAGVLETNEIPRYVEMIGAAMARAGWDLEEFDVYRCRMEFPIVPSAVQMSFALPEGPRSATRSVVPRTAARLHDVEPTHR